MGVGGKNVGVYKNVCVNKIFPKVLNFLKKGDGGGSVRNLGTFPKKYRLLVWKSSLSKMLGI